MKENPGDFPGWPSGEGRSVCEIQLTIEDISKHLEQSIHTDRETRFIWRNSDVLGVHTIVSDTREISPAVMVVVDKSCEKLAAFRAVLDEIIEKLPDGTAFYLEDDYDVGKRLSFNPGQL